MFSLPPTTSLFIKGVSFCMGLGELLTLSTFHTLLILYSYGGRVEVMERWGSKHEGNRMKGGTIEEEKIL